MPDLLWTAPKAGEAEFVSVEGEAVVVRSSVPAPPGARLDGTLTGDPPAPVRIKSHGSKKEEDGSFTIKGRLLDATRELRERVASLAKPR
jgi:hypothetical protein